jgi:phosphate starvation-inducible membrane PsiE
MTEHRTHLQLGPVESYPVVDSMLTAFLYLNFIGYLVTGHVRL